MGAKIEVVKDITLHFTWDDIVILNMSEVLNASKLRLSPSMSHVSLGPI